MPEMINPFADNDAFNMVSLTNAINILPNQYGKIQTMNLMPVKGVRTRVIIVEEKNGVLNLLPTRPVGSPGTVGRTGKRKVRTFNVPHIPHDDEILPDEYDGIRAFGSETEMSALAQIVNDHQQTLRNKHDITLEHLRMGALKGIILDADGTVLYNLYTEFGIKQKTIDFALDNDETKVRVLCMDVSRHIEQNAFGAVFAGVYVLCSSGFFDDLIEHENVKAAYANYQEASDRLGGDPRKGFKFGGLTFEEYIGQAPDEGGTVRKFIADGEAHAFPLGTMNVFSTLCAPADFLETVNTLGKQIYTKMEPKKFNRGMDLHSQSNPLPIRYRPGMLVKLTA